MRLLSLNPFHKIGLLGIGKGQYHAKAKIGEHGWISSNKEMVSKAPPTFPITACMPSRWLSDLMKER